MLELRNITKDYTLGGETIHALKGVDIAFRKNEFVSILGHSGCGKTTMLNIIGGLDRYTDGDLIINGRSTKEFRDRDWDSYRNHSIGFVFQSYNLIPHQNVLSNVELALTLSGVSKAERRRRAKEALEQVGLGDQLKKMPNQMSGGQMQRVAIARALVNNPDILLADEPTGALDSETSVQIMELLKEVAKDRLVIMVTHNPELAEYYSTRIVRLIDGLIVSDSMPYDPTAEEAQTGGNAAANKKPSMSFLTALGLSLNNLMTKKGRTILTAFAGSIGIIGIALILSLSSGAQSYIDTMEEETLTSYPITIPEASMDFTSMMLNYMTTYEEKERAPGKIYSSNVMTGMMDAMMAQISTNDLKGFKAYLEEEGNEIAALTSEIRYSYDTQVGIYTATEKDPAHQVNPAAVLSSIGMGRMEAMGANSMMMSMDVSMELSDIQDSREADFELVTGAWPQSYNEVVLMVTNNYEISDYTLYALGLYDTDQLADAFFAAQQDIIDNGESTGSVVIEQDETEYTYEDLMNLNLKLVLPTDYYAQQEDGTWLDMREDESYMADLVENAEPLHIVGIVRANSERSQVFGTIGYTQALTEYVISCVEGSDIMRQQKGDTTVDVFTGLPFPGTEEALAIEEEMAREAEEAAAAAEAAGVEVESAEGLSQVQQELLDSVLEMVPEMYREQFTALSPEEQVEALIASGAMTQADFDALAGAMEESETAEAEEPQEPKGPRISSSTYEDNLSLMHAATLDSPNLISLYSANFEDKEAITDALDAYNNEQTEAGNDDKVIQYTDYVGMLMSSVTNIVNMVSYVLIAFVGISLVVSSIMIGVITLISVQERTKEIGILRSIGASKRDISRVFNAETLIIGLAAGAIGIGVTVLLNIPINMVINHLAGVDDVSKLPVAGGVILVIISVVLTLIAGLIPAKTAANKDPVEALRTE